MISKSVGKPKGKLEPLPPSVDQTYKELFSFLEQIKIKIFYNQDRQAIRIGGFHAEKFQDINTSKNNFEKMNTHTRRVTVLLNKQLNVSRFKNIITDLKQYKTGGD